MSKHIMWPRAHPRRIPMWFWPIAIGYSRPGRLRRRPAVMDIDHDAVAAVAAGVGGSAYRLGVSDADEVARVFTGLGPLHGLVARAGIGD